MHQNSMLRSLLSVFVGEHVCAPVGEQAWAAVPQGAKVAYRSTYVCRECSQHHARVDDIEQRIVRPGAFAVLSRSRAA
jgi:hypothetical protein